MYVMWNDQGISQRLIAEGIHEPIPTALFPTFLRPGQKVVDVGGNIGYYVLLEASNVGPSGRVLAIEPNSQNLAVLNRNIQLNRLEDVVTTFHGAVSNHNGIAKLHLSEHSNWHRLRPAGDRDGNGRAEAVRCFRLDDVVREHFGSLSVNVIRMDVDGHEIEVFDGMTGIIEQSRDLVVFVELHPDIIARERGAEAYPRFVDRLREWGFTSGRFIRGFDELENWNAARDATTALYAFIAKRS